MSPAAVRELALWSNGQRLGTWSLSTRARMEFKYDETWLDAEQASPLSLSLPLPLPGHNTAYAGKAVDAYFDNLLPESEAIRRRIQERFHTASRNSFDLLAAIGRDCVGAIQIVPAEEAPTKIDRIEVAPLSDDEVAAEIAWVTSSRSLSRDHKEFRISIAGAQEKTAFVRHGGKWCRPVGSTPTTHIFKLPLGQVSEYQADMSTSVENEWLCAKILAAFGLPVARCEIGQFGSHKVLIVERFDRQLHANGRYWLRLMQEDFCQATGLPWHMKYQSDGGPGILDIADILRGSADPDGDREKVFKAQLIFFLLAAIDGHAKNFSIRILPGANFRLTPFYDVLSAWPVIGKKSKEIPIEKANLAMSLPGKRQHYSLKTIQRRHFDLLLQRMGVGQIGRTWIDDVLASVPDVIEVAQRGLPRGFPQAMLERILQGLKRSAALLES